MINTKINGFSAGFSKLNHKRLSYFSLLSFAGLLPLLLKFWMITNTNLAPASPHFTACDTPLSVEIGGETNVCRNDELQLVALPQGGAYPYQYAWYANADFKNAPISNDSILTTNADGPETYYLQVISDCGDTTLFAQAQKNIAYNPTPTLKIVNQKCSTMEASPTYAVTVRAIGDEVTAFVNSVEMTIQRVQGSLFDYQITGIPSGDTLRVEVRFTDSECVVVEEIVKNCDCSTSVADLNLAIEAEPRCSADSVKIDAVILNGGIAPYLFELAADSAFSNVLSTDELVGPLPLRVTKMLPPIDGNRIYIRVGGPCGLLKDTSIVFQSDRVPNISLLEQTCDDAETFCTVFSTDFPATISLTPSRFNLEELGDNRYRVCGIFLNESVQIIARNGGNSCESSALVSYEKLSVDIEGENGQICAHEGDLVTLNAVINGGAKPILNYEWFANEALSGTPLATTPSYRFTPSTTQRIFLRVTTACDQATTSFTVSVDPKPGLSIDNETLVCNEEGDGFQFEFVTNGDSIVANPGQLTTLGNGRFLLQNVPKGQIATVISLFDGSVCDTTLRVEAPITDCTCRQTAVNTQIFGDSLACDGEEVNLRLLTVGTFNDFVINWYPDNNFAGNSIGTGPTIAVSPPATQTYYAYLTSTDSCFVPVADSVLITIAPNPVITIDSVNCRADIGEFYQVILQTDGDEVTSNAGTVTDLGNNRFSVDAVPLTTTLEVTSTTTTNCKTTVSVTPPENCGCAGSDLAVVAPDTTFCLGSSASVTFQLEAEVSGGRPPYTIDWYDNPRADNRIAMGPLLQYTASRSTELFVVVTDSLGCSSEDIVVVTIGGEPELNVTFECAPNQTTYRVSGTTTANSLTANGSVIPLDDDGIFLFGPVSSEETLELVATDIRTGCAVSQLIDPKEECCFVSDCNSDIIPNRLCVIRGDTTLLKIEVPDCVGCTYEWSPTSSITNQTGNMVVVQPQNTTLYAVDVFDANGCLLCSDEQEIIVTDCGPENIFLPNAFTPNGDNLNDQLVMRVFNVLSVRVIIFNRWGQEMVNYVWENPNNNIQKSSEEGISLNVWDGTFNGELLQTDVFGFYLEASCAFGDGEITHTRQGNITLLR